MDPKNLSIKDFTYSLPEEKIAFHPLQNRDDAKLLIYKNGVINADIYQNIAEHLTPKSLMVFNNTKVVEARLLFKKESGSVIEIFCLEPHECYADITTAMNEINSVKWQCLIGGASKWKDGTNLTLSFTKENNNYILEAYFIEKRNDCFVVELKWNANISFAEVLHYAGHVPLPPYIKRADKQSDKTRYQTVFAKYDGSVAAPTAGLHFTNNVIQSLSKKNIKTDFVTLHVGAGTFKPVKASTMQEHDMHSEFIEVTQSFIEHLITQVSETIIAVGTTSLRTLESLYWLGCKLYYNEEAFKKEMPFLSQWEVYKMKPECTVAEALQAIIHYLIKEKSEKFIAKTQILIAPGYNFKIVNALVTNFHQPASTLLLLVAAFIGKDWKSVYEYALKNDFRFLSYGDGSLLWRKG